MTRKHRGQGFTLIEIMLVVGLVGIIASAALVPLIFTIRSMEDAQARWGTLHNVPAAADRISRDLRMSLPNPSFSTVRIVHKSGFGSKADDRLLVWSEAPKYDGSHVALVVYRVLTKDGFSNTAETGLYRWVLTDLESQNEVSGDMTGTDSSKPMTPIETDTDKLDPTKAKLVLSGVTGIGFSVLSGDKWVNEYDGKLPKMLKTEITTETDSYSRTERFPNGS